MADRVTYGPFTLYESDAYKARKKAEEAKASVELEKSLLELRKLKQEDPEYRVERAGELADKAREIAETLKGYNTQTEINKNQLARITSAAAPLPSNVAGPVMPEDAAMSMMSPIDEQNRLIEARTNRLRAQLETVDKERQGLQGSVNLGDSLGTAPAGDSSNVLFRRAQEWSNAKQAADGWVASSRTPEEQQARMDAVMTFKPYFDAETRRQTQQALKIPGLEGMASNEQGANEMRKLASDFAAAAQNIDDLIDLSLKPGANVVESFQKAEAIRGALRGQLRTLIAGPGTMSDRDVQLMNDMIANPINPTSLYAREKLAQLKGAMARKIASSASVYGFKVRRIQDLVSAGGQPEDFKEFTAIAPAFNNEAEARSAGFKDGDTVRIGGVKGTLTP